MKKQLIILCGYTLMLNASSLGGLPPIIGITALTVEPTVSISGEAPIDFTSDSTTSSSDATKSISEYDPKGEEEKRKVHKYIENNVEDLKVQIAQGDGEKLDTLSKFYPVVDLEKWKILLQKNYSSIFANDVKALSSETVERISDVIFRLTIGYSMPSSRRPIDNTVVPSVYSDPYKKNKIK